MKTDVCTDNLIAKHILNTAHSIRLSLNSKFEHIGLNGLQARILRFVKINSDAGNDIYQKDIEAEFKIKRSSVTSVLNTMEKNGFIERKPVSSDARLKKIILTEKSFILYKEHQNIINDFDNVLKINFTEKEISTLIMLLNKVESSIKEKKD